MKKTLSGLRVFFLASAVMMLGATSALSAPQQALQPSGYQSVKPVQNKALDFELHNATGHPMAGVYCSPTGVDSWGDNILPSDEFADGDSLNISFSPDAEATEWDLRVDWSDDSEEAYVYWIGLSLPTINSLTLYYDDSSGKTTAQAE